MIDFSEIVDGDAWELFCRDYLAANGFVVEVPPGRGPDGGRDLIVSEQLRGLLATRKFSWLVSCKHHSTSKRAVGLEDETNVIERLKQHNAHGFLGFYSTMASASLVERLRSLRASQDIEAFEIYDARRIEASFHDVGLAAILLHHLPSSHTSLRPIHPLLGQYQPLKCEICDKDVLKASVEQPFGTIILFARSIEPDQVVSMHVVCKGECDDRLEHRLYKKGLSVGWDDLGDYCNPLIFMRRLTGYVNQMRSLPDSYSKSAHDVYIDIFLAVSQRTLRHMTEEDREHFKRAVEVEAYGF